MHYHNVGGKDLLRHVVERVLLTVNFPTGVMPWCEWFRAALLPARPVLASYPGVARWLLLHGPIFSNMMPVVDSGIASLPQAGFGPDTAYAYTTLFNTAMMTIAADDRVQHEAYGARDHASLRDELMRIAGNSPGIGLITRDVTTQYRLARGRRRGPGPLLPLRRRTPDGRPRTRPRDAAQGLTAPALFVADLHPGSRARRSGMVMSVTSYAGLSLAGGFLALVLIPVLLWAHRTRSRTGQTWP